MENVTGDGANALIAQLSDSLGGIGKSMAFSFAIQFLVVKFWVFA
jgi:hypothetical protein